MKKPIALPLATNQLRRLTEEEQQNPLAVIHNFYDTYHLNELRQELWDWLTAGLTNDSSSFKDGRSRSDLIFLYEQMECLTEAAFLVLQQHQLTKK